MNSSNTPQSTRIETPEIRWEERDISGDTKENYVEGLIEREEVRFRPARSESAMVAEFMVAARQEMPNHPAVPSFQVRKLRAALMIEEVIETIRDGLGLELSTFASPNALRDIMTELQKPNPDWDELHSGDLVKIADGCADTKVVTIGTELACGIKGEPVFDEVHRSNLSKFIDGSFREDGKYVKGPSYSKPDILGVLDKQTP